MLELVQNKYKWNRRESPSTETLQASSSFDLMWNWSMHQLGPFFTSSLPNGFDWERSSILKWRNGMSWFNILKLIPWRHIPQRKGCSGTPLEQVNFSLLPIFSTSALVSNAIEQYVSGSSGENWNFLLKSSSWIYPHKWYSVDFYHCKNILVLIQLLSVY